MKFTNKCLFFNRKATKKLRGRFFYDDHVKDANRCHENKCTRAVGFFTENFVGTIIDRMTKDNLKTMRDVYVGLK